MKPNRRFRKRIGAKGPYGPQGSDENIDSSDQSGGGGGGGVSSTFVSTGLSTESRFLLVNTKPIMMNSNPKTATIAPIMTVYPGMKSNAGSLYASRERMAPPITKSAPKHTGPERVYSRHVK
jgi:hypothetical protein